MIKWPTCHSAFLYNRWGPLFKKRGVQRILIRRIPLFILAVQKQKIFAFVELFGPMLSMFSGMDFNMKPLTWAEAATK